ncbi:MAG: hypothetical protein SGPRY_012411 [Prymnesium sp.]
MAVTVLEESAEGEGPLIKVGDKVVLHSTASVKASGHVFDDSRTKGTAYTVAVGVNQAIQGMDKALQQMRKGCRRVLLMTSDEAYGELGLKPHVPPNADVVYDVEVLAVNESLVAQGMRVRREEEERIQRFLRLQDAERAYEVRLPNESRLSESSEAARKRRKKEKKRKREKDKKAREKHKSKKQKKEKREKKDK